MVCRVSASARGIEAQFENLARLEVDLDAAAARAVVAGGDEILTGMQANVPVDTGELKATLERSEPQRDGNVTSVLVGMPPDAPADVARYGNAQEYGYRRGGRQYSPQSFIRSGFDQTKAAARRAMRDSLEESGKL